MGKGKATRSTFENGSPWVDLQREVTQGPSPRKRIIKNIEKILNAKVVTLFTAFDSNSGILTDEESEMLENVLAAECGEEKQLVLIINSPGGQALAAERIANVCRNYSKDETFRAIVPHMAKSAATMVCFGASEIMMSKTAELGPVDPQVPFRDDGGNQRWISAEEYVRSFDKLFSEAASGNFARLEPFLQQLQRYDSRYVEQLRSAQQLSRDISLRLLKSGMLSKVSEADILGKIDVFLTQAMKSSHGRMISAAEAASCGLNVNILDLRSELWKHVWHLYVRSDWVVSRLAFSIVESSSSSVMKSRAP